MRVVLGVCGALLFSALMVGCATPPCHVLFIVPDGFRGGFALELDRENGLDVPKDQKQIVIRVSKDGLTKVTNVDFLGSYLAKGRYESGGALWKAPRYDDVPPVDTVCLFDSESQFINVESGAKVNKSTYWWFVGTEEEFKKWRSARPLEIGSVPKEGPK